MTDRRVAIVTGASRGIGAATALEFARRGYAVAVVGQDAAALGAVADSASACGVETLTLAGDLADLDFAKSVVTATVERWRRVDVLVNNAAWREIATMRTISRESWERTLRICLTTPAFLARWAAEAMEPKCAGTIVNVSSSMSQTASGFSPAYVACKGGLDSLTYELASLYAPRGIRVVAVNPGAIDTDMSNKIAENAPEDDVQSSIRAYSEDMIMLRRWGRPAEIAQAIAWLASDEASYITGTTLVVDGGWLRQHLPFSLKQRQLPDQFSSPAP